MRILEIQENIKGTSVSQGIYDELIAHEVDTLDEYSPDAKQQLVDEIGRAEPKGKGYSIPLSDASKNYLTFRSIPSLIDIAEDNGNKRLVNALIKFQAKLQPKTESLQEGLAARISHPEDLVWQEGGAGAKAAIDGLQHIAKDTKSITIKWDGTPALIFGRDPVDGQLVVTDKSGFGAKRYNGHSKSAKELHDMLLARSPDQEGRGAYAQAMASLWPLFEKMVPESVRGYYQGDLMYTNTPPVVDGAYQFKPNKVEYRVPVNSKLGQQIARSRAGIVVHGFIPDRMSGVTPVSDLSPLRGNDEFMVFGPEMSTAPTVKTPPAPSIFPAQVDEVINPNELRQRKLTDFGQQVGKYMAAMARAGDGNYNDAAQGFLAWIDTAPLSDNKRAGMKEWISEHLEAYNKMWQTIQNIHAFKTNIKNQIDTASGQEVTARLDGKPGHEGYVANTPFGVIKLVDRHEFMKE